MLILRDACVLLLVGAYGFAASIKHRQIDAFVAYLRPVAGRRAAVAARGSLLAEGLLAALFLAALADGGLGAVIAGAASAAFLAAATAVYSSLIATGESSRCGCFGLRQGERPEGDLSRSVAAAVLALRNATLLTASLLVAGVRGLVLMESALAIPLFVAAGLTVSILIERHRIGDLDSPKIHQVGQQMGRLQAQSWWLDGKPRPL